jgi:NADPH:quinone reductase
MKAAVYYETGPPSVFKYEEVQDPECGPHDVLIETKAISVEGGDVVNRAVGEMHTNPFIIGYCSAGVILATGENVSHLQEGQRVATLNFFGSHAEKRAVPFQTCWPIPEDVSFGEAACVPVTFGTAHDCIFEFGRLQKGETVLIQGGAGGVGLAAIQFAKQVGARVLATASSDERLKRLKAFGLDHGINYKEKDLVDEVNRLTDNAGVNLVVDPIGSATLEKSIRATGHRGRIISMGSAGREFSKIDISAMSEKNRSLTAIFQGAEIFTGRVPKLIGDLLQQLGQKKFKVHIDRQFPLSRAAEAHAFIESRQALGRVVLIP